MDSASPKRLAEFLSEQQEPFILDRFLRERGYKRRSFGFQSRRVKRSARYFTRVARDICMKLVSINEAVRLKDCDISERKFSDAVKGRRKNLKELKNMEEPATFSSASFLADLNSSSGSDLDEMSNGSKNQIQISHQTDEVSTDRNIQWRVIEENRQRSPVSVLDEIEPIQDYHVRSSRQEDKNPAPRLSFSFPNLKKATEESIFSASLWNLFIHSRRETTTGIVSPSKKTCTQQMNSKRALHQTRQLLFDCVREAVESRGRQRKEPHLMGTEELGKIICNNIRVWDKQSANGKKITELLRSDLLSSYEEEEIIDGFKEEVVKEVGDKILEEIKDDLTNDIIDLYLCRT